MSAARQYQMWSFKNAIITALGSLLFVGVCWLIVTILGSLTLFRWWTPSDPVWRSCFWFLYVAVYMAMFGIKTKNMVD